MFRKVLLPLVLVLLGFTLWSYDTFKEIAAGISILLFGMILLEEGFKSFSEGPLEKLLKSATNKLFKSITLGGLATAVLQSSSLISILTISFISAGLISLKSGIGVIYGANIGTTTTAWLVAALGLKIKIDALAMPMLVFGILLIFQKKQPLKGIGSALAGLGFFFLGVHYMKEGFEVFESSISLAEYTMSGFTGIAVYAGIGILMTLILQSSSATMTLILIALAAGQISYLNSLSLAIGANIGTTITAILGSLGANVAGKRLAGAHLIFNMVTGIFALIFIYFLADVVDFLSSNFGIGRNDYALKLSLFHTIFNIIGVLLMLPFTNRLVHFLERVIKEKPDEGIEHPKYLNKISLDYPSAAIEALLKESKYLLENAIFEIVSHSLHLHREDIKSAKKLGPIVRGSTEKMKIVVEDLYYKKVKIIYSKIIKYASITQQKNLTVKEVELLTKIKLANRHMAEAVKALRDLHKNIGKFMASENEKIQKEYGRLRKKLSRVLREIYQMHKDEQPDAYLTRLKIMKDKAIKSDVMLNGILDRLIRDDAITSEMASSLANDSEVVARICRNLIEAAELLYTQSETLFDGNGKADIPDKELLV